jgi:hypothetical protein
MDTEFNISESIDDMEVMKHIEMIRQMHATFVSTQGSMDVQVAIFRAYAQYMQYDLTEMLSIGELDKMIKIFEFDFDIVCDIEVSDTFYQWLKTIDKNLALKLLGSLLVKKNDHHNCTNKTPTQNRFNTIHTLNTYLNESLREEVSVFDLIVMVMRDYVHTLGSDWLFKPLGLPFLARAILVDAARTADGYKNILFIENAIYGENLAVLSVRHIVSDAGAINIKNLFDDSMLDDPVACKKMENRIRCQDRMQVVSGFIGKFLSSFHELKMNACSGLGLMSSYEEKDLLDAQVGSCGRSNSNRKPVSLKTIKQD